MADRDAKKYYWLKLQKDFFKRHDIRIIENMPNGKDYVIFYLKLLCESTSHEGLLRFNDEIPYNDEMLATITNTNIDVVRSAIKLFSELKMMELLDDGTLFMKQVAKMIGSETGSARRMRKLRANKEVSQCDSDVSHCLLEIELDKEIDIDIDKELKKDKENNTKTKRFTKPSIEDIQSYCSERNNNVDVQRFYDYYESNGWKVGKNSMKDWKAAIRTWERNTGGKNEKKGINITKFDV